MAAGETKNETLYEQLAAACAEQGRAGVEHCAQQGPAPGCSERYQDAMDRIVLELNGRPRPGGLDTARE